MNKEYILIDSKKVAEIKYKALQKLAANKERPLSEASIEARAVIEVVNYIYENNETLSEAGKRIIYNIVNEIPNNLNEVGDENVRVYQKGKVKLEAEYKKYVEHWGDPIDPINYKLYSIETDMPCFHPDNRLFTIKEFRDLRDSNESFRKMWELK